MRRNEDLPPGEGVPIEAPRRRATSSPKFWVASALVALFVVFVLLNRDVVPVNYIFFIKRSRLIWVMLVCGVIGFLVGWLYGRPGRAAARRASKKNDPKKA